MATLLKKGHYTAGEQEKALDWAEQVGLEVVYTPMQKGATPLHAFLTAPDKTAMIEDFPRDISPTTDDRPYFFNYTRWNDPFSWKKHDSELPSASQGNPLFILTQLAVSIVLGVLLILLPLVRRGGVPKKRAGRYVTYFAGLGLGFILIEIALIQKMTLFLGQPVYSLTVTLFSLLVFTGLGSLVIAARIGTLDRRAWAIPAGLAVLSAVFVVLFPSLERAFITLPLAARAVIAVLSLAPFGLLLGVPFAYGLRVLHEREPELLPWAWAVNGCMSVVGSVLTVVISMNAGFRAVLAVACLVYFIAFMALSRELASSTATGSA
jgi:hypothetical protein